MSDTSPSLRDLPALAVVLARAYSYGQGWPSRLAAVRAVGWWWRPLVAGAWLLLLVMARSTVRSDGRGAVVMLSPGLGLREVVRASWRGLLVTLAGVVLLMWAALQVVLAVVSLVVLSRALWLLSGVVLLAVVSAFVPVVVRERHDDRIAAARAYAWQQGERNVVHAGMLATWPRGHGHMTRLLERVQGEVDAEGICLVAYARSEALAVQYARHGFRPVPGQGPQTLYRPGARRPGH